LFIFNPVKSRNFIMPFSSLLLGIIFLAGSTGITIIIHNCPVCEKHSVHAGLFLSPTEPEDHCCDAADNHCSSGSSTSLESTCCHFKIEKLRLTTSYAPAIPLLLSAPAELPSKIDLQDNYNSCTVIPLLSEIHNKHGGRYLITFNCQLIS